MAEDIKKEKAAKLPEKKVVKPPEKKEKVKLIDRIKRFFRDYKSELKKIVWPTRAQLIKNTSVVLVAVIFMAIIIGVLDLIFGFGIRQLPLLGELIRR
jgi:preprotein translocase subunit SecE